MAALCTFRVTGGLWEVRVEGMGAQLVFFLLLVKEKGTGGRNTRLCGWCHTKCFGVSDHRALFEEQGLRPTWANGTRVVLPRG